MQAHPNPAFPISDEAQHEVLFAALTVSHRRPAGAARPTGASAKVARLSCCCRISELVPLVRQLHDTARATRLARELVQVQQAA